ncbi:hypothetical protein Taro_009634 [Colocasia esculenta]|uniref:Methyltransferase-like protein 17, mitochondrial n=1 Tax=Colocasia esculenta TaxID=4460 RepID=A0A843UAJ2_COLES|nr:hypothetical protein [Colocasia esculenta]
MAQFLVPEAVKKAFTPETLRAAARQSERIALIPLRLRRAIKRFFREREQPHMHRKVLLLAESFCRVKKTNLQLADSASRELIDDPLKSLAVRSRRWKIKSSYGEIGLSYCEDETSAYVASRMPAVFAACRRILREVRRRLPDFAPSKVLDFGAGPGTAVWAMREVWPHSLEHVNLVEPSKSMQRASQSLLQNSKNLPLIRSYDSIQALSQDLGKHEREHDLVIASYVLGEIPSLSDRITLVRQLWTLTKDVLVLVEPGTPHGSKIISQMRSHILWMSKRKCRKMNDGSNLASCDTQSITNTKETLRHGAYVVAPCPHDGPCPLENTTKYCHFVQRLERTSTQRAYKRTKSTSLRGFEDEKFCYVALRRGERPRGTWPLDGMEFETLKQQRAKQNPEDLIIDYDDQSSSEVDEIIPDAEEGALYASDVEGTDAAGEEEVEDKDAGHADLSSGWGRILFSPVRRGRQVTMDVCRSTNRDGSDGMFERVVVTRSKNPDLHHQARKRGQQCVLRAITDGASVDARVVLLAEENETSWSREVFEAVEVLKDSEDEVLKNTDVEQANESAALEDASEKKNAKDDKSDKDKLKKTTLDKEEKARKVMDD